MTAALTGPIAREIHRRLTEAFQPTRLLVRDDSESHRGHGGHNAESGESHFTVEVESAAFAGMTRLSRQRAINAVLADLLVERVHALAIKARASGE
jgi:BolA family transcriptional regulator, general stress-responsive regulator